MQNPILDIIARGGQAINQSYAGASASLANASNAISQAGSIAVKLDLYLQNEEARKSQEVSQAQQNLNSHLHNMIQEDIQNKQLALQNQQFNESKREFGLNFNEKIKADKHIMDYQDKTLEATINHNANTEAISGFTATINKENADNNKIYKNRMLDNQYKNTKISALNYNLNSENNNAKTLYSMLQQYPVGSQGYKDILLKYNKSLSNINKVKQQMMKIVGVSPSGSQPISTQQQETSSATVPSSLPSNNAMVQNNTTVATNNVNAINSAVDKVTSLYDKSTNKTYAPNARNANSKEMMNTAIQILDSGDNFKIYRFLNTLKGQNPKALDKIINLAPKEYQVKLKAMNTGMDNLSNAETYVQTNDGKISNFYQSVTGKSFSEMSGTEKREFYKNAVKNSISLYGFDIITPIINGDMIKSSSWNGYKDLFNPLFEAFGIKSSPVNVNLMDKNTIRAIPDELYTQLKNRGIVSKTNMPAFKNQLGLLTNLNKVPKDWYGNNIESHNHLTKKYYKASIDVLQKIGFDVKYGDKLTDNLRTSLKKHLINNVLSPEGSLINKKAYNQFLYEKSKKYVGVKTMNTDNDTVVDFYFLAVPSLTLAARQIQK